MDSVSFLLLVLFFATLVHIPLAISPSVKILIPYILPGHKNEYSNFHPANNFFRAFFSIAFLLLPVFIFKKYRMLAIDNELVNLGVLAIFISLTLYLIYFNRHKIWSKSFRTVKNPKITSERAYSENQKTLHQEIDKIKEQGKEVQEKYNNTTTSVNSLSFEMDQVKTKILTKEEKKLAKQTKRFAEYFTTLEQFKKFKNLLHTNDFYERKTNISVTNLCILTSKLIDLKVIYINQEQKYYCIATASYFNIPVFDNANLSRILKDNEKGSFSYKHQEFYDRLSYLNKLKQE